MRTFQNRAKSENFGRYQREEKLMACVTKILLILKPLNVACIANSREFCIIFLFSFKRRSNILCAINWTNLEYSGNSFRYNEFYYGCFHFIDNACASVSCILTQSRHAFYILQYYSIWFYWSNVFCDAGGWLVGNGIQEVSSRWYNLQFYLYLLVYIESDNYSNGMEIE